MRNQNIKLSKKEGQYLAFIYYYTKINSQPPAYSDFQRYFKTDPTSVYRMLMQLETKNYISKIPKKPRSISITISTKVIPDLD